MTSVDCQQWKAIHKWLIIGLVLIYLVLFSLKHLSVLPATASWFELVIIPMALVGGIALITKIALRSNNLV
jgi:hypothetical protein